MKTKKCAGGCGQDIPQRHRSWLSELLFPAESTELELSWIYFMCINCKTDSDMERMGFTENTKWPSVSSLYSIKGE